MIMLWKRHPATVAPLLKGQGGNAPVISPLSGVPEWELSIGLEFKSYVLCKSTASKKNSIWYELYFKKQMQRTARANEPEKICVLGSFILARVTGQFIVRLKLFSYGNYPLEWNSNPMPYGNPLIKKTFWCGSYYKKYLIAKGS